MTRTNDIATPMTPQRFDALTGSKDKLWGLTAIANALSVSDKTVGRYVDRDPSFPVRRCGGRWFTTRTELNAWLRRAA